MADDGEIEPIKGSLATRSDNLSKPVDAIHGKAIDAVCEDDRSWFRQNPERNFRIRDAMVYEFNGPMDDAPEGMTWRTLVAQANDRIRMRLPVALPVEAPNDGATDARLAAIFHRLAPENMRKALEKAQRTSGRK